MTSILILKTGALGDVLRTTSILEGLHASVPDAHVEWVTAPAARDLVAGNPRVARTHLVDPGSAAAAEVLGDELAQGTWDWVISLDDERALCELATRLGRVRLSGALIDEQGERSYSADVAPWFEMGLLSKRGKAAADRMKVENTRSHPEIYAQMLGIEMGRPELGLEQSLVAQAEPLFAEHAARGASTVQRWVGLNTGAGGRWTSKQLPVERVIEFAGELRAAEGAGLGFVLLGGRDEAQRNAEILSGLRSHSAALEVLDGGTDNSLLEFAAIIDRLDLLLTSDSLALHMAVARRTPLVAFFAPTSAAEIELYGLGQKVVSTAPDYCSYRPDTDNSTITPERLVQAARSVLRSNVPG